MSKLDQNPYQTPRALNDESRAVELRTLRVLKRLFWVGACLGLGGFIITVFILVPIFVLLKFIGIEIESLLPIRVLTMGSVLIIVLGGFLVLIATLARMFHAVLMNIRSKVSHRVPH